MASTMDLVGVAGAIALPNVLGLLASRSVPANIPWYESLERPPWRPPNWLFGPAWTALYTGMGYASYVVYKSGGGLQGQALIPLSVYGGQLLLNTAWTPIFFKYHKLKLAVQEIVALDLAAIATGYLFYKVNSVAGYIFVPYLGWLAYATALSYSIYRRNPQKKLK